MDTPASKFDASIERWVAENDLPWMKLKTEIGLSNLQKHLPQKRLRILDAGGGSGADSIPLAREGHSVDLLDYSPEMLKVAERNAKHEGLQERIRMHRSDVSQINRIFPQPQFDLIVCHNVLQFVGDVPALLDSLAKTLVPGGILSLISGNRYTIPFRAAFLAKDLDGALRQVGARTYRNPVFQTAVTEYSAEEMRAMLPGAGLSFDAEYGIRCLSDYWGDNETKSNPEVWEKIKKLEYALTDRYPYNLLARFWQIIAHKAD
jgi:S-adenosylmethionine-dependent methyltransferase